MSRLRIKLLAVTGLVAITSFAGASAAWANFLGEDTGTGTTALGAQHAATQALRGDFSGCTNIQLVYDIQSPPGTWTAEVAATCTGYN